MCDNVSIPIRYELKGEDIMRKFTGIITIIISAAAIVLINTVCKPCHGLMPMPCEHSTHSADAVLLFLIVLNAATLFVKNNIAHTLTAFLNTASGIFLQFIPSFGRCQIASMSCNMKTFPVLRSAGLLIAAFSLVFIIVFIIKNVPQRRKYAHVK